MPLLVGAVCWRRLVAFAQPTANPLCCYVPASTWRVHIVIVNNKVAFTLHACVWQAARGCCLAILCAIEYFSILYFLYFRIFRFFLSFLYCYIACSSLPSTRIVIKLYKRVNPKWKFHKLISQANIIYRVVVVLLSSGKIKRIVFSAEMSLLMKILVWQYFPYLIRLPRC